MEFSLRTRKASLEAMGSTPLDVLVIGGGIVGAWTALAAALRGRRTGLVEKGDFASGTSGKTSRLIHGGLRYLQQFRIGLVRQAARERDHLLQVAPRLVKPITFLLPVYRGRGPREWQLRIGLYLYDALSREKVLPRRRWLSRDEALRLEPGLNPDGLESAALYSDACAHDARLVLRVVQAASEAGALVANYAKVTGLLREGGTVRGAEVLDKESGTPQEVRARFIVNATGVWSPEFQSKEARLRLRPTKGIHAFARRERIGHRHAIALTAKDGRIVFVLPWGALTLIGTTDTDYRGDPDHVEADREEVEYLLATVNTAFPRVALRAADILGTYAGLRPLIDSGADKASDVSRKHVIVVGGDGLVTVAGGKLTTARAIAEEVLANLERRGLPSARSQTRGGRAVSLVPAIPSETTARSRGRGVPPAVLDRLEGAGAVEAAGRFAVDRPELLAPIVPGVELTGFEVSYSAEQEMVVHLDDLMARRTDLAYTIPDGGIGVAAAVAGHLGEELGWDAERRAQEVSRYRDAIVAAHQWRGR